MPPKLHIAEAPKAPHDRNAAIIETIARQVRALAAEHLERAESRAAESDTDGDKPVIVSLSLKVQWPAGAEAPTVKTSISYGSPIKDETEETVDPLQGKLFD